MAYSGNTVPRSRIGKQKDQGGSDSSSRTTADPIMPSYPHDTFKAPSGVNKCTAINEGAGTTSKGAKIVNKVPPRC